MLYEFIQSAPSEAWVGVGGVLLGALISAFSSWLTSRASFKQLRLQLDHEEKLHNHKQKKERLEELYILVCHWGNFFFSHYLNLKLVMEGHATYDEHNVAMSSEDTSKIDYARIEMIIDIYGGKILGAYNEVKIIRAHINEINAAHKAAYCKGESGIPFIDPAYLAQLKLDNSMDSLKRAIADAARAA